eukprot:CAMPEP_0197626232 /NCGR_PEP_ID=MMETSP1338-20131121/5294_1 /TAXON_ID=43686 ORGANISM="Pelagodinium beii, Strain RCC1491" /NCGR_SAMPLE_ID=MMETSP1338 /ASSEMBLY_ACC=CAM_ASM_000754 /LENGTH=495 /DNA_ID=CAMNT_0043196755 /DNA_START=69 /DNA_END=1556 /DNA_ORIENTATION=+
MAAAKSQMKAVKSERSLQSSPVEAEVPSRLSQLRSKGSQALVDTKSKAVEVAELATVKAQAAKVQAVDSLTSMKDKTSATLQSTKQSVVDRTSQTVQKVQAAKTAAAEQAQTVRAATGASYEKLRSNGVKAWVTENVQTAAGMASSAFQTLRASASKQYASGITAVSNSLKSGKDAVRSRAAALLEAVKGGYADTVKASVKAVETAKVKAVEVSSKAKTAAKDGHVQATAAGVAGGAATLGATGAATGLAAGSILGSAIGIVPALFTFGLSIPIGAAIGGGAGLAVGTTVGATAGAVGGGAAGYGIYTRKDDIASLKDGAMTRILSSVDLMKGKAMAPATFFKEKTSEFIQGEVQKVLTDSEAKFPDAGPTFESSATLPQEQTTLSRKGIEDQTQRLCEGRGSFIDAEADTESAASGRSSFASIRTSVAETFTPRAFLADRCRFCGKRPGIFGMKGFGLRLRGHERRCAQRHGITLVDSNQNGSCSNSFAEAGNI